MHNNQIFGQIKYCSLQSETVRNHTFYSNYSLREASTTRELLQLGTVPTLLARVRLGYPCFTTYFKNCSNQGHTRQLKFQNERANHINNAGNRTHPTLHEVFYIIAGLGDQLVVVAFSCSFFYQQGSDIQKSQKHSICNGQNKEIHHSSIFFHYATGSIYLSYFLLSLL